MGVVSSCIVSLQYLVTEISSTLKPYDDLLVRSQIPAGLPVPNPTRSFWMYPPSIISSYRPSKFPQYSDVVIIGSGITGTSIARTLFQESDEKPLKVVMLEARQACSGATGRNGGHLKPPLHNDYRELKARYGIQEAMKIIRFRIRHFEEARQAAQEEDIMEHSQCREVEGFDVYFDEALFNSIKEGIRVWKRDMPLESSNFCVLEREEAIERFALPSSVVGVVTNPAGAIHAYRFVTGILENLLKHNNEHFELLTETPCINVHPPSASSPLYAVETPRGTILTHHVVHATNGWASYLLKPMSGKVFPLRGTMSAQRPGASLSPCSLDGMRSWVFYEHPNAFDYLTQLPDGEHELMFGGGYLKGRDAFGELGTARDDKLSREIACYHADSLPMRLGHSNWGEDGTLQSADDKDWYPGRIKAIWTGVMGLSADGRPWVGRLPSKVSGRKEPKEDSNYRMTSPGEWIAAGYSGEGMAHAWLCGQALAYMILDKEAEGELEHWFPDSFRITEERWRKARTEDELEAWLH